MSILTLFFTVLITNARAELMAPGGCPIDLGEVAATSVVLRVGDLLVTTDKIFWKSREVAGIQPTARRFLLAVADRANEFMSPEDLVEDVWPLDRRGEALMTNSAESIKQWSFRLRKAFRSVDPEFAALRTERGVGVMWVDAHQPVGEFVHLGHLTINVRARIVRWRGQDVPLPAGKMDLVFALVARAPEPLLLSEIYPLFEPHGKAERDAPKARMLNIIRAQISQLRTAFRIIDPAFNHISPGAPTGSYAW